MHDAAVGIMWDIVGGNMGLSCLIRHVGLHRAGKKSWGGAVNTKKGDVI